MYKFKDLQNSPPTTICEQETGVVYLKSFHFLIKFNFVHNMCILS